MSPPLEGATRRANQSADVSAHSEKLCGDVSPHTQKSGVMPPHSKETGVMPPHSKETGVVPPHSKG